MELKEGRYIEDIGAGLIVTLDRRVLGECGQYVSVRGPSPNVCFCEMELTKRRLMVLRYVIYCCGVLTKKIAIGYTRRF